MQNETIFELCTDDNKSIKSAKHFLKNSTSKDAATWGVLKSFVTFTGKNLRQSLFFINFIKKEAQAQVFSCKICEFLRTPFLYNTSERLLLTRSKLLQLLILNFLAKFLTERKYLINTLIFVRRKYLYMKS